MPINELPSEILTVPVGVPVLPFVLSVTAIEKVTGSPTTEEAFEEVTIIVVAACVTASMPLVRIML
jgi:hypothetical protein